VSVTDGIGQTPCSFEHYLVIIIIFRPLAQSGRLRNYQKCKWLQRL